MLILSAFFSATETSFTSLNRARLKVYADDGNKSAKKALKYTENYDKLLYTILIGNNIVNLTLATISTLLFSEIIKSSASLAATLSTIISTITVLIFGEITPKTLAKESPEKVAMFVCPIVDFFTIILYPLNLIFTGWKALMKKVFKFKGDDVITEEVAKFALDLLEVDKYGLDHIDRNILLTLIEKFAGGPTGLDTLAAAIGEDAGTLEEVYEPYLIKNGYLNRTPRGRAVTALAYQRLGLPAPEQA